MERALDATPSLLGISAPLQVQTRYSAVPHHVNMVNFQESPIPVVPVSETMVSKKLTKLMWWKISAFLYSM